MNSPILASSWPRGPAGAVAALGPLLAGAVLALCSRDPAPLFAAPAIVAGVLVVTLPALYIGSAASGSAPPAGTLIAAGLRGLAALGLVLAGLAGPALFLAATSEGSQVGPAVVTLSYAVAGLFGLGVLRGALFAGQAWSLRRELLFVGWATLALLIGARLWFDLLEVVG
jgi:hypothetical protein